MEIRALDENLIYRANQNSFNGTRGNLAKASYEAYANKIMSWPVSDEKKEKLLDKLYEKRSEILRLEAQHVSVMVAGPARYNARKLDKGDRIMELSSELHTWFEGLEDQIKESQKKNSKVDSLIEMVEFCRKPDNPCNPTSSLEKLALYDNKAFVKYYEEMYQEYKWRKNSNIAKLYQKSIAGELQEIKKEVFFEDENLTAYTEADRAYIKFIMKPQRQLIVALKSRGWFWNSYKSAWSTYLTKLDKEFVAGISTRYAKYI